MKWKNGLTATLLAILLTGSVGVFAQDQAVTDEELKKYAVAMDSVNSMRENLIETISEMVKNNNEVTAARYNELSRIINDESKLAAANATEQEVAFIREVVAKKDEETEKINQTFQSLAREYVGAATYNKVKRAIESDADVKSRYETILQEVSDDEGR